MLNEIEIHIWSANLVFVHSALMHIDDHYRLTIYGDNEFLRRTPNNYLVVSKKPVSRLKAVLSIDKAIVDTVLYLLEYKARWYQIEAELCIRNPETGGKEWRVVR